MTTAAMTEEISTINSLSSEIIKSIENLYPTKGAPQLGSFEQNGPEPRYAKQLGYNHSIPITFNDKTEWDIKFPLSSRTTPALIDQKIKYEDTPTKRCHANTH